MKGLSLFANVGIGETYFDETDVEIVVANEWLQDRADFYSHLYPDTKMIPGDIMDTQVYDRILKESQNNEVEFIMATPPCQGMSVANAKRADKNDPRNSLIKKVVSLVKDLKPKYILIENVEGMARKSTFILDDNGNQVNILPYLQASIGKDYVIDAKVLDASDYSTPHYRKRLITLISRRDVPKWEHPQSESKKITVKEAIGDLPSLESGEDSDIKWHSMKQKVHNANHIQWMKHTPTGQTAHNNKVHYPQTVDKKTGQLRKIKGFATTYKRIEWDRPAPTVTMANGSISSQNNVHPGTLIPSTGTYSDARVLTIKELLFIVGLPPDWVDDLKHDKKTENFLRNVIGECFPPKMALKIVQNIPKNKPK